MLLKDRIKDMTENPDLIHNFARLDLQSCSIHCKNLCGLMSVTDLKMKFARMLL